MDFQRFIGPGIIFSFKKKKLYVVEQMRLKRIIGENNDLPQ